MKIRKKFKFESAHIVRNAVSARCKYSIHGHSYKVEVCLKGNIDQKSGMVLDFIEFKNNGIAEFIDMFDHTMVVWSKDSNEYINNMNQYSRRVLKMNLNPTAENMAIFFHYHIQRIINKTCSGIEVEWVRVHETDTGYAQSESSDLSTLTETDFNYTFKENND